MKKLLLLMFISLPAFSEIMTLECIYPNYSDAAGVYKTKSAFGFKFVSDTKTEKTYLTGSNGSSEVLKVPRADGGMNYVEIAATGNVMITTVLPSGDSVHSRNSAIGGQFVASQYYGSCKVT